MAAGSGTPKDVEKASKNKTSRGAKIAGNRDKTSGSRPRT
jgi:hypothetical protein